MRPPVQPGDRFGRLVAVERIDEVLVGRIWTTRWRCLCDCGATREVQQNVLTRAHYGVRACVDCTAEAQRLRRAADNRRRQPRARARRRAA